VATDPRDASLGAGHAAGLVVRPARPRDLDAAARVLVAAFPSEFRLLFGPRQRVGEDVAAHVLHHDYPTRRGVWVACDGERIVGVMLLAAPPQLQSQPPWRLAWHVAWRHVGLWRLPRLALALLLPRYTVQRDEVYVRAIGVLAEERGRGAGTMLLACAETWARDHHKRWLGLHVHRENPGAHRLHQRLGYRERGYRASLITWILLQQRGAYYLRKPISTPVG
jgi:GNAT superfamily N-acetyltransferase